eukprot:4312832-Pleurochrysis_carterae.AAC.1
MLRSSDALKVRLTFQAKGLSGTQRREGAAPQATAPDAARITARPYFAKATYSPLRRWGEWRLDGPTYTSLSIQILIYYLVDSGETPL